MKQMYFALS